MGKVERNIYQKGWRDDNKEHVANWCKQDRLIKPNKYRAKQTLSKHKRKGCVVEISSQDVELMLDAATHCPICGRKLTTELGIGNNDTSPSLDRKNNENTMNKSNVWIICSKCNMMKGEQTMKEFINHCKKIVELNDASF